MSKVADGKFACDACGKQYTWKPLLAGKRAKCACGATMVVPAAQAATSQPPADDLYDVAEPAVSETKVAPRAVTPPPLTPTPMMAPPHARMAPVAAGAGAGAIGYRSAATAQDAAAAGDRFSLERMTHAPRDVYVPVGLLIAGFVAMLAWAAVAADAGAAGMIIMSVFIGVATIIKVAILIAVAMVVAPMLGISFGEFRTALLKFAAIIVFTDAATLWVQEIMEMAGGAAASGRMARRMIWINLLTQAVIISFLCHYLFDMDGEETGYFAIPMAVLSWLMGVVMWAILLAVLEGIAAAAAAATTPPPAPPAAAPPAAVATPAPAPPPVPQLTLTTETDRQIARKLQDKGPLVVPEANAYIEKRSLGRDEGMLVRRLYNVGAVKVHFDLEGGRIGRPVKAYAQLPDDPEARKKCFAVQYAYAKENGLTVDPAVGSDVGQRYLIVDMKQ